MINSKEHIIEYFKSGIKNTKNFRIGIEHEKFLFNNQDNKTIIFVSHNPVKRDLIIEYSFLINFCQLSLRLM